MMQGKINENIEKTYSVSELTGIVKGCLRDIGVVRVLGEVSNCKASRNGVFFALKDGISVLNAVVWNPNEDLENGQKVNVLGKLNVFGKSGSYNLVAEEIGIVGSGILFKEYMDLKERFRQLGYFDEERKKKLPDVIEGIGVITSYDGAALKDFLYVLKKNGYVGKVVVKDCVVQGRGCSKSVCDGIRGMDILDLDVIVVMRGGGSFEDLFGFSDENVIKCLYGAKTCTVSAIGHEVDFMLSDFVADIRAPTPSLAGELVSSTKKGIEVNRFLDKIKGMIIALECRLNMIRIVGPDIDKVLQRAECLLMSCRGMLEKKFNELETKLGYCVSDIPKNVLVQGHSSVIIDSLEVFMKEIASKKKLKLRFRDGQVTFDVRGVKYTKN